ncbi:hypothetical protein EW145_g5586 [Phellinidium pouzarii]|uniref:non-specific serine/threonine protein kinase n=1 Tax=Phellinidium pouzarii TaxID=167371 RepID=A0A4S4KZM4_9AGAM|nr:hypothetical protein EW145_g5586 [Phellinidium pouzarii]
MVRNDEFADTPSSYLPELVGYLIDDDRLRLTAIIGRGSWGVVYRAETVADPDIVYAVKCLYGGALTDDQKKTIQHEVSLHNICALETPRVLRIHTIIENNDDGILFIVSDLCEDGDLLDRIISGKYAGQGELIKDTFVQILDGLEACHRIKVYHRDLKPENVFVRNNGKTVVLGDFGFATTRRITSDFRLGSEPFMSPEVRGGLKNNLKSFSTPHADIWALGVILMNLVTGCLPWTKASLKDKNFAKYIYDDPDHIYHTFRISREANEIFKSVFTADPRLRTSIADLRTRIKAIKSFWPGVKPEPDFPSMFSERYISVDFDLDTDSDTLSDVSVPLHVVNGDNQYNHNDIVEDIIESGFLNQYDVENQRHTFSYIAVAPLSEDISQQTSAIESLMEEGLPHAPMTTFTVASEHDISDEGLNYDDDNNNSDSESVADSEGPITPETRATDTGDVDAPFALDDIDNIAALDLGETNVSFEAVALPVHLAPVKDAHKAMEEAKPEHADAMKEPSAKRMFLNAARLMGMPLSKMIL